LEGSVGSVGTVSLELPEPQVGFSSGFNLLHTANVSSSHFLESVPLISTPSSRHSAGGSSFEHFRPSVHDAGHVDFKLVSVLLQTGLVLSLHFLVSVWNVAPSFLHSIGSPSPLQVLV
jgi:hypothetical protein